MCGHPVVRVVRDVHPEHPENGDRLLPTRRPLSDRRVLIGGFSVTRVQKLLTRLRDAATGALMSWPSGLLALSGAVLYEIIEERR